MYIRKFGLQFIGKEVSTEREFGKAVDLYAAFVKKDSSGYV